MLAEKANYPIWLLCKVMQVSKQGYFKWLRKPVSKSALKNLELSDQISKIHKASRRTYGRRRIRSTLSAQGSNCCEKRVARIMKKAGLQENQKLSFKVTAKAGRVPAVPNHLRMNFSAQCPDQVWLSDITYVATKEGWLYVCVVIDAFSRPVVGWSMSERMHAELVQNALNAAFQARPPLPILIFHSDRGSQYNSGQIRKMLGDRGSIQSMSGTGNCYDNAMAESFFATLKKELVHKCDFKKRDEATAAIFEFIEVFYNRFRVHSGFGFMSPIDYEAKRNMR